MLTNAHDAARHQGWEFEFQLKQRSALGVRQYRVTPPSVSGILCHFLVHHKKSGIQV
jgi:hypothetical protein